MTELRVPGERPAPAGGLGSAGQATSSRRGASPLFPTASGRRRADRFGSRAARLGVFGAALAFLAGAAVFAMISPALGTADETGHVDYAFQLWHGHLPIFENGVMFRPPFGSIPPVQWEAQHPPLFYALLAPAVGPLVDGGHPMMAVLAARAIGAVLAALCVVGLGWAAGALTRHSRTAWMISAAAVAAPISPFLRVGGSVYNDDIAVLFTVLALGITLRAIRFGVSRGLVVAAALVAAGGMLSRANFIITLLTMCGGLVLAWWIQSRSPWPRRIAVSIGIALIPVAAAGLFSGWFYLRNLHLTGSLTGGHPDWAAANLGRRQLSIRTVLRQTKGGWTVFDQLYAQQTGKWARYGQDLVAALLVVAAAVSLGSVGRWLARRLSGRRLSAGRGAGSADGDPTPLRSIEGARSLSVFVVMAMQLLITMIVLYGYMAGGGGSISRYLLPALFTIAVVFAFGVICLPPRWRAAGLALYSVLAWGLFLVWVFSQPAKSAWSLTRHTVNGVPGLLVVVGLVALVAGVVATLVALQLDAREPEDPPRAAALPDGRGTALR